MVPTDHYFIICSTWGMRHQWPDVSYYALQYICQLFRCWNNSRNMVDTHYYVQLWSICVSMGVCMCVYMLNICIYISIFFLWMCLCVLDCVCVMCFCVWVVLCVFSLSICVCVCVWECVCICDVCVLVSVVWWVCMCVCVCMVHTPAYSLWHVLESLYDQNCKKTQPFSAFCRSNHKILQLQQPFHSLPQRFWGVFFRLRRCAIAAAVCRKVWDHKNHATTTLQWLHHAAETCLLCWATDNTDREWNGCSMFQQSWFHIDKLSLMHWRIINLNKIEQTKVATKTQKQIWDCICILPVDSWRKGCRNVEEARDTPTCHKKMQMFGNVP